MASSSILVKILGDSKGLQGALNESSSAVGGFVKGAAKTLALGAGALTVAGIAIGKSSVGAASDLNETISKTKAIFDDSADSILAWSDSTAQALGISQAAALDFSSGFGGALKEIGGLSEATAASTAQNLVGLTADLGSFFNAANEDVAAALGSALTGEFEPLKKYNIIINDALLKQKALELGIYDGTGALDAQAKQAATLALIYDQTGDAQGDFAKTSDGLANTSKILSARFEDLKTELGEKLLPVVTQFAGYLLDNMPAIERVAGGAFQVVGDVVQTIVPYFQQAAVGVRAFIAAFQGDGITSSGFVGYMEALGVIARDVFAFLRDNVPPIISALVTAFQFVADWVAENWPQISAIIIQAVTTIQTVITAVVDIVTALWNEFGDDIVAVIKIVAETIVPVIKGALDIISGVFEFFAGLVTGDWGRLWDGVKQVLSGALTVVTALIKGAFNLLKTIVGAALEAMFTVIKEIWGRVVDFFSGLGGAIKDAIGDLGSLLKDTGRAIIDGLLDGIQEKFGAVKDKLGELTNLLPDWKGPYEKDKVILKGAGQAVIQGFNDGLRDEWAATRATLAGFTAELSPSMTAGVNDSRTYGGDTNITINNDGRPWAEQLNEMLVLKGALVG